jgi:hypothetical protein
LELLCSGSIVPKAVCGKTFLDDRECGNHGPHEITGMNDLGQYIQCLRSFFLLLAFG